MPQSFFQWRIKLWDIIKLLYPDIKSSESVGAGMLSMRAEPPVRSCHILVLIVFNWETTLNMKISRKGRTSASMDRHEPSYLHFVLSDQSQSDYQHFQTKIFPTEQFNTRNKAVRASAFIHCLMVWCSCRKVFLQFNFISIFQHFWVAAFSNEV